MNLLIIGAGGREHALAWKALQSPKIKKVFVAPGNAGTYTEPNIENLDIQINEQDKLIDFVKSNNVILTIVGPEAPLVEGIVDRFEAEQLACFGPTQKAAQLEGSKAYCKAFLKRHHIPTADSETFESIEPALDYLNKQNLPIVIKADGLAAGKGVVIAQSRSEAENTVRDMLEGNRFGKAGHRVVIEEFLEGEEASFICMLDGKSILPLATSQDHKARDEGDKGPNTGGMGAYSPAPVVTPAIHKTVMETIFEPTLRGLQSEDITYKGFLYAGLMINQKGEAKVLEFNCRFGDPETQPILMRLKSDLVELCTAGVEGTLDRLNTEWDPRTAVGVVMAAGGYPEEYQKGEVISGLDNFDEAYHEAIKVFHAGTSMKGNEIVTNGGRVLCVTALGSTLKEAQSLAYSSVNKIHWNNCFFRKDIGDKGIR